MSPELNGNPPVLIKRKKNKKHASSSQISDYTLPASYNSFQSNVNTFQNTAPINPFLNYLNPPEPISLPVYSSNYQLPVNINYSANIHSKTTMCTTENDYLSLPVINGEANETSGKRRFSDPGLPNESDSSCNSATDLTVQRLMQQVDMLRESNRQLARDVVDLRTELSMLKQQQQHSRMYDREYAPGLITDIIREIRDAARIREDALLAKVKHIVEEKQLSLSQLHLAAEKNRNNERLLKLEEQMKSLNITNSSTRNEDNISFPSTSLTEENGSSTRQVLELEKEALNLRRELQDARAKKEESDQKIVQLDKKLSSLLRTRDMSNLESSDDCKTSVVSTVDSQSQSSIAPLQTHRITLSGPVTDL